MPVLFAYRYCKTTRCCAWEHRRILHLLTFYSFFLTSDCNKHANNPVSHNNSKSNKINNKLKISNEFVYWTPSGTKYHSKNCRHLHKNNNLRKGEIEEALFLGKEPCSYCYAFKSKEEIHSSASNVNELISLNESRQNKIR